MRALALGVLLSLAACGGDDTPDETLYERLGGEAGIRAVVDDTIARVDGDERINGYFRNASVDGDRLAECLVLQLGAATGGPQTYPSGDCRSMAEAHAGLGISAADMADFVGHLSAALDAAGVGGATRDEVLGLLGGHEADIVEDPDDNATVYQRVGRKPAISAVVTAFEQIVVDDPEVNGFFAGVVDLTRLHACLTRLVCSIDGPCRYGEEVAAEFEGLSIQFPCRDMASSHYELMDDQGSFITIEDFNAIAANLVMALTDAGVAQSDIEAIVGAVGPLCGDIVAGGEGCP